MGFQFGNEISWNVKNEVIESESAERGRETYKERNRLAGRCLILGVGCNRRDLRGDHHRPLLKEDLEMDLENADHL